ncbi:hypothetical protein M413DRAFT_449396 [Hebeloma cylindrosporum]|uniref:Nephrocystin 3-like N-terminal domain-containing protein n=1 Tax=Hebeloma cylindrosporum TaxID=76867 RepID=A0A0C2Y4U1_HEBCY|nr:hypothetical protein M413DRAFT_449396 [Hebeloma cylindrosporum h7]
MFSHSRNVAIFGGNFTQVTVLQHGARGIDLLQDASSPSAIHNSEERFPPPKCHENTRVAIIEQLMRWILGHENRDALIMWLLGPAGAGKSAIAQTLAELCNSMKILLASFFFFRTDPTRNHSRSLFPTIAYQLAINLPDARDFVVKVPEDDPMVFTRSIEEQLSSLIINPLQELYLSGRPSSPSDPYLVIIDGLDECGDAAMQISILQVIAKSFSACDLPFKFLIASRPEMHLTSMFNSRWINPIFARLALDDNFLPEDDIRLFLRDSFDEIRETHPLASLIGYPIWPSPDTIERLVRKSSGQFIFASTVMKFIASARRLPTASLDIILGLNPSNADAPFAELDALYINILSSVSDIKRTMSILGFLILSDTLQAKLTTTRFIEDFLMLSRGDSHIFAGELASVLTLGSSKSGVHGTVNLLHASLSDFLLDQSRSNQFALDLPEIHAHLACMCFRALGRYFVAKDFASIVMLKLAYPHVQENLVKHCSVAAPTPGLRNAIQEFSHDPLAVNPKSKQYLESTPMVVAAIRATSFHDAEKLCAPHVAMFESFLSEKIGHYYSNPTLTFIAAAISTPCQLPSLAYDSAISDFLGRAETREAEKVDHNGLYLFSFFFRFDLGNAYKEFLAHFLTTEARSGHCVLTGQHYSTAAELCLKYLHKLRHYPRTDEEGDKRLMEWALECLPSLLDQSIETEALVRSA